MADFFANIWPSVVQASQKTGIDPRIIAAQAALESGYGRHAPGNNLFGIKSHGKGGGNSLMTTEVVNGQPVRIRDSFRAYESPADSVMGYAEFMTSNPRYKPMRAAQGLDAQVAELGKSGYATDPNYASKIGKIARSIPFDAPAQSSPLGGDSLVPRDHSAEVAAQTNVPLLPAPQTIADHPVAQPQDIQTAEAGSPPKSLLSLLRGDDKEGKSASSLLSMLGAMSQQQQPQMLQPPQQAQGPTLADILTQYMQSRTV